MKSYLAGFAIATWLVGGLTLPGYAQDAAAAKPAAPQTETPPPSVPRPSLAPKTADKTAEPATPAATKTTEPDAKTIPDNGRRHRRYARRDDRRGHWRTTGWEPFPIYWPHVQHNRIQWSRIPWALHL